MAKTITAARKYFWTALGVSTVGQFFLTTLGNNWPEDQDSYGAPFSVGDSTGWSSDALWVGHAGNFFLPLWVANVGVTAVIVLALAIALNGGLRVGLVAAPVAVFAAYLTVVVVQGPHGHSNQMLIWLWMLVVLAAAWGIRRRPV